MGLHLVVTDLDGSLLDHDDYNYDAARPVLQLLEEMRIPVVFASSKTRPEMVQLRNEIGNEHPFIVENGAAVCIPRNYFLKMPEQCVVQGDFWVRELCPPRERWSSILGVLREEIGESFTSFAAAGVQGIAAMTGLPPAKAALANEREYSEPVQWYGSETDLAGFLQRLNDEGATVLKGGRFYSVGGDSDKGKAWCWLREQFAMAASATATVGSQVNDLAIGDGGNDVSMLDVAHRALPIPAHNRPLPSITRTEGVIHVDEIGPAAWAQGVTSWLREIYQVSDSLT